MSYPTEQEMKSFDFAKYRLAPLKAIRLNCLDCMGFQVQEVRKCSIMNCPLHPYRLGKKEKIMLKSLATIRENGKNEVLGENEET